ncbi:MULTISPECIES: hypothetical protein [Vibrio]|uniref:Uncharacterized protein n=2 Tax=Vibrio TaxID=662 RepID=A0A1E5CQ26_9VIBR|nr:MULTISPECIES: hypothetical protein [Vibrio]RBW65719.1 hypothetical protein DS893_07780 [Vibrionales bacterium C3R12]MDN3698291.1 hypothetical protein [Vibrio cortegadensis]NOH84033.1 hypothetical protein [Vibrio sp. 03-59-1]OEE71682.1 hypothetical protein A130_07820 [Vibrio genomosp. F6 str. FF-238]TKF24278.1 hypothetical protein FCV43_01890 [Vibrio genomosp. F6]
MLWDTLDRVNRLRQEALANPEFVDSAKEHELALEEEQQSVETKPKRRYRVRKPKALSDIYDHVEFASNPTGIQH